MPPKNIIAGNKIIANRKSNMQAISPNGYVDDISYPVGDIGFNFPFYGTTYRTTIFVSTNSYITFGFSSSVYNNLSSTVPGRSILIAASDNGTISSILVQQDIPGESFRIRFRGTNRTVNTSTQDIVWEVTLFSDGKIRIKTELIVPRSGAISMITKGDGNKLTYFTTASNQSLLYTYNSATDDYLLI